MASNPAEFDPTENRFWYSATVRRVIDGDTVELMVDLGFRHYTKMRVRVYGVDTPELRSRDADEKVKAQAAKKFTQQLCPVGSGVMLQSYRGRKSFDRWVGRIFIHSEVWTHVMRAFDPAGSNWRELSVMLVTSGHGEDKTRG